MAKKCIICEEEAQYCIKDTSDYYCDDCALESFGDLSVLVTIEQQAKALKDAIDQVEELELEHDTTTSNQGELEPIIDDEDAISIEINKKEEDEE